MHTRLILRAPGALNVNGGRNPSLVDKSCLSEIYFNIFHKDLLIICSKFTTKLINELLLEHGKISDSVVGFQTSDGYTFPDVYALIYGTIVLKKKKKRVF